MGCCGGFIGEVFNGPTAAVSNAVSDLGKEISKSPIAQAAITVGGTAIGIPPAVTAGVLGANQASQTGNLVQGLTTGGLSYLGGQGVNNFMNTGSAFGASAGSMIPGIGAGEAGYTLTGDAIADAAVLKDMGYGGTQISNILGGGGLFGSIAGGIGSGVTNAITNAVGGMLGGNTGGGTQFDIGSLIGVGANLAGGYLNNQAAADAATKQANATIEAAKIAAAAQKFKPVGVTTRFGSSNFGYDANGNLTSAGYTLTPEMKAQQDQLMAASGGMLNQFAGSQAATAPMADAAQRAMALGNQSFPMGQQLLNQAAGMIPNQGHLNGIAAPLNAGAASAYGAGSNSFDLGQRLSGQMSGMPSMAALQSQYEPAMRQAARATQLGGQYLAGSPQEQAQKYMSDQQALLAPSRATDLANLRANLAATGRGGLMVGGDAGMSAANPELNAYYNSLRQQDLGLAAQATQGGMDYSRFGAGLVDQGTGMMTNAYNSQQSAMSPWNTLQSMGQSAQNQGANMYGAGAGLTGSVYDLQTKAFSPFTTASNLGMDYAKFATGMVGSGGDMLSSMYGVQNAALRPYMGALNATNTIEGMGQNPMDLGTTIGAQSSTANANAGRLLGTGMTNAANTIGQQEMAAGSPWGNLLMGGSNALSNYKFGA